MLTASGLNSSALMFGACREGGGFVLAVTLCLPLALEISHSLVASSAECRARKNIMGLVGEFSMAIFEFMLTRKTMLLAFFFLLLFVLALFFLCRCWDHVTVSDRNPTPAAAASRLSCSDSRFKYDVFISFRGPDTRIGFTSHLYYALRRAGIKPFMDHKLEKGQEISQGLFDAIERSKILVVVLSQNFASSTWCLDELAKIIDCRRRRDCTVLPVFYGVKPAELRRQTGRYEAALAMHQNGSQDKGMAEKVKRWREALTEIANLFGYDSDVVSSEGKLVNDIVDKVLKMLQDPSLVIPHSRTRTMNEKFGRANDVGSLRDGNVALSERVRRLEEERDEERRAREEHAAAIACLAQTLLTLVEKPTALQQRCRHTDFWSE